MNKIFLMSVFFISLASLPAASYADMHEEMHQDIEQQIQSDVDEEIENLQSQEKPYLQEPMDSEEGFEDHPGFDDQIYGDVDSGDLQEDLFPDNK